MSLDHKPSAPESAAPAAPAPAAPTVGASPATIYRSTAPGGGGGGGGAAVDRALGNAGGGAAHPSGAQIHTDEAANAAANELGAQAFTAGKDVYFAVGQYNPGTPQGDALINHELEHVAQGQGVAPPTPGNFKVSSPNDAAEHAATAAESGGGGGGGKAAAGTIHRKVTPSGGSTPAPVGTSTAPSGPPPAAPTGPAGTGPAGATPAGPTPPEPLQEFFDALAAHNVAAATAKWAAVPAADKGKMRAKGVKAYPGGLKADPVESIIDIMGKDGLPILREVKAAFDKVTYVDAILNDTAHGAAYWMPALKANAVYNAWFTTMPSHGALTDPRAKKLDGWMTASSSVADARQVFEHAYPKLMDASYLPTGLKTAAWGIDDIKRSWTSLNSKLPVAHVNTIAGGFNLGTDEKLFHTAWTPLGFGWHDPGANVVVMPKASSLPNGNGTGHDMTGGDLSGVKVTNTKDDPKLSHWDGTMLHEIGHGVGSKTDGNTFAQTHGDWKGGMAIDAWSKHLFDDAAATKALPTPPPKKVLAAADARAFLAAEVGGGAALPAGWTRPAVVAFINAHYANEKLTKYWTKVKGGTEAYYVDANNHDGDRTYVWLQRGGLGYSSYKKEISDNKVSWYSLSSTVEWFAEQYTNYYRTNKTGAGADATTKAKLDAIDKMDATATGGLQAPASPGGAASGGAAPGGATPDAGEKGGGAAPQVSDADAVNKAAAARIRRMSF